MKKVEDPFPCLPMIVPYLNSPVSDRWMVWKTSCWLPLLFKTFPSTQFRLGQPGGPGPSFKSALMGLWECLRPVAWWHEPASLTPRQLTRATAQAYWWVPFIPQWCTGLACHQDTSTVWVFMPNAHNHMISPFFPSSLTGIHVSYVVSNMDYGQNGVEEKSVPGIFTKRFNRRCPGGGVGNNHNRKIISVWLSRRQSESDQI